MEELKDFLKGIFDTSLWPRRWACGEWSDFHGWLYIVSDFFIGLAYTGIPIVIATYVLKKDKDVQFRGIFWLFFAFILLCGFTHFMDATIFWWPAYRLSAVIRFATAVVSIGTLFALYKIMPTILEMKTSAEFQAELFQRIKAQEELIEKNEEITKKVEELRISQAQVTELNERLEKRMYFLAESMPLLVWTTDAAGNADFFNKKFIEYSGKGLEELKGSGWLQLINPEDLGATERAWEIAVQNKTFYSIEHRLQRHDGVYHYFITYGDPMLDENGEVLVWVGASVDIDERKMSEQYLLNSHDELKKLNTELDSFVYSISHDLRAPLTNIMGMANVGKGEDDVVLKNEVFNKIQYSAKRLDDYILSVLDYSRNSRLELKMDKINFEGLISQVWENYQYLENTSKIVLKINLKAEAIFYSDTKRLEAIFNNLISNAIKYTDLKKKEPCITVSLEVNKEEATIIIEDNGIGIEQEQLTKVFEIFYRASEAAYGSGLGLYIVKEVVEKLGGKLKAKSEPGVGTSFIIKLPNHAE
jgi:PAS domain S-box-containing protein